MGMVLRTVCPSIFSICILVDCWHSKTLTMRPSKLLCFNMQKNSLELTNVLQDLKLNTIFPLSMSSFIPPPFVIVIINYTRAQTFYKLNRKFDVPSVRRPPLPDIATQAVLEKVANDPSQQWGVGTIGTLLSNEGVAIPRSVLAICSLQVVCFSIVDRNIYF